MRQISSDATFFYKRVFPVLWFGFLAIFCGVGLPLALSKGAPFPLIAVPVFLAAVGYIVMKKFVWDLADKVWDDGDALVIRNRNTEARIPFSEIMNVSYTPMINPPRVTLTLNDHGRVGTEISFMPQCRVFAFSKNPIVNELIERVHAARNRTPEE